MKRVRVWRNGRVYEGFLVSKKNGMCVLKLNNGYNIGLKYDRIKTLGEIERPEADSWLVFGRDKPEITLITAGGTILSRVDYRTGGVYALEKPEELLLNVPELSEFVNVIDVIKPFEKMSEDMDWKDWEMLGKFCERALKKSRGIVVAHGTDTMGFTSAALSFFFESLSGPIVLTGAQRSTDRGSSDGFMNLICSSIAATTDISEVTVCMHENISDSACLLHRGTKVRKMHSSRRDAFKSVNQKPIARIYPDGKVEILSDYARPGKTVADFRYDERVALIKIYPGSEPGVIDFLLEKGYRGFVLEATGLGHVPVNARKSWIPTLKKVCPDVPVVITTQTLYGRVHPHVYSNLRVLFETGTIPGGDMLPETAYVKLGIVLGRTRNIEKVKNLMTTNMRGELTERSVIE
ncbi:MAG: Glu-tRNA(Gln) amidotransferase subunit GatD [Candidatus Micrarchaeota archaeon]|nr:Glu-tRNA(Gln) amidotransferase subunit GatD [Candidatus Micrarchaeota archaeon]